MQLIIHERERSDLVNLEEIIILLVFNNFVTIIGTVRIGISLRSRKRDAEYYGMRGQRKKNLIHLINI